MSQISQQQKCIKARPRAMSTSIQLVTLNNGQLVFHLTILNNGQLVRSKLLSYLNVSWDVSWDWDWDLNVSWDWDWDVSWDWDLSYLNVSWDYSPYINRCDDTKTFEIANIQHRIFDITRCN
jgi:hypothetical protein